jgi:glycosyltransferase involved in cell wall biosynthesis
VVVVSNKITCASRVADLNGAGKHAPANAPHQQADSGITGLHRSADRHSDLDLTIFVACYNEAANIVDTLDTICVAMRELPLTYEILVIDDASRDASVEKIEEYKRLHPDAPVVLVKSPNNRGLSRNFVEGAFLGRGRYYKLVCGDNVDTRENLLAVFRQLGSADLVIPYHGLSQGRSVFRRALSRTYTRLVNTISGYSLRYYNGCGLYRRADVMRWHSRTTGFGFQAELVVSLLNEGATFVEVPIDCRERQSGNSTALKFKNWVSVGATLLRLLMARRRSRRRK